MRAGFFVVQTEILVEFFHHGSLGSILHNRSDTHLHGALGSIHLAGADDLSVAGLEVEERLAVLGFLDLEAGLDGGVLLNRLDAVEACGLGSVALAGEDHLAVGGLKVKLEFSVLSESNNKLSHF